MIFLPIFCKRLFFGSAKSLKQPFPAAFIVCITAVLIEGEHFICHAGIFQFSYHFRFIIHVRSPLLPVLGTDSLYMIILHGFLTDSKYLFFGSSADAITERLDKGLLDMGFLLEPEINPLENIYRFL